MTGFFRGSGQMDGMGKDPSIVGLLDHLDLSAHGWVVVDHWEGDRCAVGIASKGRPGRLVYVSTFEVGPGRYDFECEESLGPDATDYRVVERGTAESLDGLRLVLTNHLGR